MLQHTMSRLRTARVLAPTNLDSARLSPWLSWRPKRRPQTQVLSVAELSECTCPELCHRDHANE